MDYFQERLNVAKNIINEIIKIDRHYKLITKFYNVIFKERVDIYLGSMPKYLFKDNGELYIIDNEELETLNFERLKDSDLLIINEGARKSIYKILFCDGQILFMQDSVNESKFRFFQNAENKTCVQFVDYLKIIRYDLQNITPYSTLDGFIEVEKGNENNSIAKIDGVIAKDGYYASTEQMILYVIKNSRLIGIKYGPAITSSLP